jgi:hypothetical protein
MKLRVIEKNERKRILDFLEERFGLKRNIFSNLLFVSNPKGKVFAVNRNVAEFAKENEIACLSLPFVRMNGNIKPTSVMLQFFGNYATKNVIDLEKKEAVEFIKGSDIFLSSSECSEGYVILKYKDFVLGCGLLKNGKIKNMLPKAKRMPVEFL